MEAELAPRTRVSKRDAAVRLAWAWTAAFLGAAVLGFVPNPLLGPDAVFVANVPHDLVHLTTAVAFAAVATLGATASVRFMLAFGVVYLLVGVVGVIALGGAPTGHLLGLVRINGADNFLHLGLGTGILASGLYARSVGPSRVGADSRPGVRPRAA